MATSLLGLEEDDRGAVACMVVEAEVVVVKTVPVALTVVPKLVTMRTGSRVKICVELSQSQSVDP